MATIDVSTIRLAEEFTPTPNGRSRDDGEFSGERFRDDFLWPAMERARRVEVVVDGVAGIPSAFWEEVFGGLVRERHLSATEVLDRVKVIANSPLLGHAPRTMRHYVQLAQAQLAA